MISYDFIMRNLGCANCAEKIRAKLDSMDNIEDVKFNINTQKLSLKSDIKDEERLMKIIQEVADSIEDGVKVEENYEFNDEEDDDKPSIIKFILVFCSLIFLHFLNLDDKVEFVIYILLFVVVGREVILSAVKGLKRKDFLDEEFLMTVASVAAIVAGEYAEAVAVMLFYSVGEYIQDKAVDNSRKSIKETLKLKPDFANVFRNEELIKIDPVDVNVGDKILIRPGEKVPLDGIITKGISDVDTSNISGEFAPVSLGLGDRIVAGYINLDNSLEVKVEKEYREGTIAKIIDLVENASSNKAEIEKFITRFARVYTPIVLSLASILFVLLKFFVGYGFKESLYRSAIFLVISCPCALVLSVPLTMFAGIGSLSKKSIFVKGGNSVEALTDIDAIAFDKTGTITKGKLTVDDILELNANKEEILEIAAIGEKYSTHPIAKAILDKKDIKQNPENLKNISGKGLEFLHNRKKYFVGNSKIIDDNNIKRNLSIENPNKIEVFVADEEKLLGIIFLSDTIKEDAKESIDFFKKLNIKTYILSGDKDSIAKEIASQIGVDNARGSLLPEDKLNEINELMKDNKLAYVGDGTNDAPALASAYLGIGMSSGTDIAIESSDIILFNNDISSIVEAIKISKRVKNIAYQNIFIALFLKVVVLILGALGNVSMPLAVFADVGVALICILNSLRVFKSE